MTPSPAARADVVAQPSSPPCGGPGSCPGPSLRGVPRSPGGSATDPRERRPSRLKCSPTRRPLVALLKSFRGCEPLLVRAGNGTPFSGEPGVRCLGRGSPCLPALRPGDGPPAEYGRRARSVSQVSLGAGVPGETCCSWGVSSSLTSCWRWRCVRRELGCQGLRLAIPDNKGVSLLPAARTLPVRRGAGLAPSCSVMAC